MIRKILSIGLSLAILWLFLTPGTADAAKVLDYSPASVTQQQSEETVVIYFFWGDGCPHCAKAKPVFEELAAQHPSIQLKQFEIYNSDENLELFRKFGELYGFQPRYVPTIFIGDKRWEGWSDAIEAEVRSAVDACLVTACPDKAAALVAGMTPSASTPS